MIWSGGRGPAELISTVTRGLFCACMTSNMEKAAAKALGFIGFLMNMAHKKPGHHHNALRLFPVKFEVGDLVKLSANEEKNLLNEEGWTPEQGNDWEIGIVIDIDLRLADIPYYKVHWIPANEVIEESDSSIVGAGRKI